MKNSIFEKSRRPIKTVDEEMVERVVENDKTNRLGKSKASIWGISEDPWRKFRKNALLRDALLFALQGTLDYQNDEKRAVLRAQ